MNDIKLKAAAELELRRRKKQKELEPKYDWKSIARPKQLPPEGDWDTWMVLAGRGWGKTRAAAEWAIMQSDSPTRGALVGRTPADVRDILIEGESGILNICPPWNRPKYEPSKRRLTWPNGTVAYTYSFENPDQLRGVQHHWAVVDELASAPDEDAWDNLMFGMRLGNHPQVMISTTPRPTKMIKKLFKDPDVILTCGATYENKANLPKSFIKAIEDKYANTRLGRQEIYAEILEDVEGALWTYEILERNRISELDINQLNRVVVAVDPSASSDKDSDETGIVVVGTDREGHGYTLDDASMIGTPNERALVVKRMFEKWSADYIVAEKNNGGDMVEHMIKTVDLQNKMKVKMVWASRGKFTRAEPISALYEQNKIKHYCPPKSKRLDLLEDELCTWSPATTKSPNRLDALVWGHSELMLNKATAPVFIGL